MSGGIYEPSFYGHDWVGLYLAHDLTETAERLRFYADFLDGKAGLLREQMLLATPPTVPCNWCDGRGIVELGDDRAADCPACSASGIETRSAIDAKRRGPEGESPTAATSGGDAQT